MIPRMSSCWWLLLLLSASGNVECNPGPALKMYSHNVNSLKGKLGVLRAHAGDLCSYDALLFVETKMAPDQPLDSELQSPLPDFTWFRRDRTLHGGGVACAVRTSLSPVHRPDLETDCESLVVQLGTSRPVLLSVCYRPPDADRAMGEIVRLLRGLHTIGRPFVLAGDFNLPELTWTGGEAVFQRRSRRAESFVDVVAECEARQSVISPTRSGNYLDLVISRGGAVASELCDNIFSSDHEAVETRYMADIGVAPRVTRTKVYNYKRAYFDGFRRSLGVLPWSLLDNCDVDDAVSMFYDLVLAAVNDHVPIVELRRKFPPWYDRTVRDLLREKEQTHRRKKAHPTQENIEAHSRARAAFKRQADQSYCEYLLGLTRDFKDNPKRYWTFIKSLKSCSQLRPLCWSGAGVS